MKIIGTVLILLSVVAAQTSAQSVDSVLLRNSSYVSRHDVWLTKGNAAALTRYDCPSLSWAEAHAVYGYGGFVNYNESSRSLSFGADVQSFTRLSPKTVVYGRIAYDNAGLHNMTGSVFMQPERYPFDIVEDSLTNPGKIHQDLYYLTGAVGYDIWRGLSLGAKVDFTAGNAAKYKDLRHKNKLMDINATFGFYSPVGNRLDVGVFYRYTRHSESLSFSTYGKTEKPYVSLIAYGAMMGQTEQFGNDGLTGRSNEQPLFYDGHGYGVQATVHITPQLSWYNSWETAYLHGYYGKDSPYTIIYMRHHTHRYAWNTQLQYKTDRSLHQLDASIAEEKLQNRQNQYRAATNERNARYYEYFQPLKTADKVWVDSRVGYTGYYNLHGETTLWQLAFGANLGYRKLTAYNYPYFRRQHWHNTEGYVNATRNIIINRGNGASGVFSKGIFSVSASFSYLKGNGKPYEDGTFVAPSDKQTPPAEMPAFLYQEYAALMAPQYKVGGSVQYAFILPGTQLKSYVRATYNYRHRNAADNTQSAADDTQDTINDTQSAADNCPQGKMHWSAALTLGVNF